MTEPVVMLIDGTGDAEAEQSMWTQRSVVFEGELFVDQDLVRLDEVEL